MGVSGEALGGTEFLLEDFFGFFLDSEVDGGGDVEAAELDVFLFEDDFEVAADGIHGVGFLGFAAPFWADDDGFRHGGVCLGAGDDASGDHALEGGSALASGGFH